ncbi:MAG: GNAT family N-acetyltransferase [Chloroflexota bacterium]|nr:GNAT family N-acetyltransferase [Chloroflexota bacterium]
MTRSQLPPDLVVRRPHDDDAQAVTELINACDDADYGETDMSVDDIREEWDAIDLKTDAWLVEAKAGGAPIGYAALEQRGGVLFRAYAAVLPEYRRRGIGTALAALLEERARARIGEAPEGARVQLGGWLKGNSPGEMAWAEGLGYSATRRFLRMRIDMQAPPAAPSWPDGITVRQFVAGQDERATFDALEEAFSDHWGHVPGRFEELVRRTRRPDFDPRIWFLAVAGDEIAATSLCSTMPDGSGSVNSLAVRRPWRRRGLGRAILVHSFAEFWGRGTRSVALGVDGASLTGATRLYESAGMYVREMYDMVTKTLRDGVELATTELPTTEPVTTEPATTEPATTEPPNR